MEQETGPETGKKDRKKSRRGLKTVVIVLLFLVSAMSATWLFRTNLAEKVLAWWCARQDLTCTATVSELALGYIEIDDLVIDNGETVPFSAARITAEMSWAALLRPQLEQLRVQTPVLRAAFDGESLSYNGLRRLIPVAGKAGETRLPPVDVEEGRIFVATPAGELSARVQISGVLSDNGLAEIEIDPVILSSETSRLIWSTGRIRLESVDGVLSGQARVDLEQAKLGTLELAGAVLTLDVQDLAERPELVWSGSVDVLSLPKGGASGLSFTGRAQPRSGIAGGYATMLEQLAAISFEVNVTAAHFAGTSVAYTDLKADLSLQAGKLAGPVSASMEQAGTRFGAARLMTVTGDARFDPQKRELDQFTGAVVLRQAQVEPNLRRTLVSAVSIPGLYHAHGAALHEALLRGLTSFDTGADLIYDKQDEGWSFSAGRASALRADSGLTLSIEPPASENWLSLIPGRVELKGDFVIAGGGAPTARLVLSRLVRTPQDLVVDAHDVSLQRWLVNNRALSVALDRFEFQSGAQAAHFQASGDFTVDGEVFGITLQPTRLSGGINAAMGDEGWRVQMLPGQGCLSFSSRGLRSESLQILPLALELCPDDNRLIRMVDGHPTGSVSIGDLTIPFRSNEASGELYLESGRLDWSADHGVSLAIGADRFRLPMQIGARTLMIESRMPDFLLQAGDGPLSIRTGLDQTEFSGSLVPARISAAGLDFTGISEPGGIRGRATARNVEIADLHTDPYFNPVQATLAAEFENGAMHLTGPVRLAASGQTIADVVMNMDLAGLTGTASLLGRRLVFSDTGLQPADISGRLSGALPNARGSMQAVAQFVINKGQLAGTGEIVVEELGVDTFRLGPVDGVTGRIIFSDLLTLTTEPAQELTIGRVNPGIVLEQGRLVFQLVGGRELRLETAIWPFAGGELHIVPAIWHVSGDIDRVIVRATGISLSALTEILSVPDLTASGTVSGVFPIDIIGPNAYIRNASLKADATGGRLSYSGRISDQAAQSNEYAKLAFDALRDFEFTVLELGVDGNIAGEIVVRLQLVGLNQEVLGGTEFKFGIEVASNLAQLIQTGRRTTTGQWVMDLLETQVLEAGGPDDE